MIYGFCISGELGGSDFGVVSATDEACVLETVSLYFRVPQDQVSIVDAEDMLACQYAGCAILTTGD